MTNEAYRPSPNAASSGPGVYFFSTLQRRVSLLSSTIQYERPRQDISASLCSPMSVRSDSGLDRSAHLSSLHAMGSYPFNGFRATTTQGSPNGPISGCRQIVAAKGP